jgi:cysteine desulfurase/selenocysteine lyase
VRVDWPSVRAEFPLLARPGLVYLDAASTTPKPRRVLEAIRRYHEQYTANVARGVHALATEASAAYEAVRHLAAAHVGASPGELVFTHGTTDGINLVAASLGLGPDDEVVLSSAEHHSNTLPWRARATCKVLPARADGTPEFAALEGLLGPRTRAVALHHVSNVLGTIAPVAEIARLTRARGIPLLVDGAQAAGHLPVDVAALGCDLAQPPRVCISRCGSVRSATSCQRPRQGRARVLRRRGRCAGPHRRAASAASPRRWRRSRSSARRSVPVARRGT